MAAWIVSRFCGAAANSPRVVELACGGGYLAEHLFRHLPSSRYCGFDLSPHLLDFARVRLAGEPDESAAPRANNLVCVDLVSEDWESKLPALDWAGQVDAVISLQALHDLGGLTEQTKVLAQARLLLRPGGQVIYGDLLQDASNPHPSRFAAAQHEDMLRAAGFVPVPEGQPAAAESALFGDFGCFRRRK